MKKILRDTWVTKEGGMRLALIDDQVYLFGNPSLCIWEIEQIDNHKFKLSGSVLGDKNADGTYAFLDLGITSITNYTDSTLTFDNIKSCVDNDSFTIDLINVSYYSKNIVWDSIEVKNYGELNNDIQYNYIRKDLLTKDRRMIDEEIAILLKSNMELSNPYDGSGVYHSIKIFYKGELIFHKDCTRPLYGKLPRIILNKQQYD